MYIVVLQERVAEGLGADWERCEPEHWGPIQQLGLSALRCQCELLRSLSYFNFRSQLLESVVCRAAQPCERVQSVCRQTLEDLFCNDNSSDLSYEAVSLIAKRLQLGINMKISPTDADMRMSHPLESLLRTLRALKLTVHADQSRRVHQKAKSDRRKRKKGSEERDSVEVGLLEASAQGDANNKKRFQADCLNEVTLIYFRSLYFNYPMLKKR